MPMVSIEGTDVVFDCQPGQSVLDAALHAGIALPYSCRKGVCGNCAGEVASGSVSGIGGAAMANDSCDRGQVLYCMCTPESALALRPVSWKRVDPSARKRFSAKVFKHLLLAPDISLLQLRLPTGQRAKFAAGQYLQVELQDGSMRCYSMANGPQESDSITLHVRHVPGGSFTGLLPSLRSGDTLKIELPFGSVDLSQTEGRPVTFVAGGTGFAPIKSILDDMARKKLNRPVTLIWGAREASGIYLGSAVSKWLKQWPDFRFVPAISEGPATGLEDAFSGRVDEALESVSPRLQGHELYCCGSPAMTAAVRDVAIRKCGLRAEDFHADVFVAGPAAAAPA